jgi:phosphonate transport system substrate-binding protein
MNGRPVVHRFLGALLCVGLAAWGIAGADEQPLPARQPSGALVLGVLPSISPVALFRRFSPLRDYLSKSLGREVVLDTAPDFNEFARRTAVRRYDIVLTAPHFVAPALASGSYRPQVTPTEPLAAVVVVAANGPLISVDDLAGRVVATPPAEALVTMVGRQVLVRRGLVAQRAPTYWEYRTHNAAYQAVIGGEAAAAIISANILNKALGEGAALRTLDRSDDLPGVGILTASDLPEDLQQQIGATFLGMSQTDDGRKVLEQINHPGYRVVRSEEYAALAELLR